MAFVIRLARKKEAKLDACTNTELKSVLYHITNACHASLSKNYVSYKERVMRRFQNIYLRDNGALWRVLSTLKNLKSHKA